MLNLPHSDYAERDVLACCLLSPREYLPGLAGRLAEDDFYLDRHRSIWRAMLHISDHLGPSRLDLHTLQDELERRGEWERVGGFAYLAGLDIELPDLGRVNDYADILVDRRMRREMILLASEISASSQVNGGDPSEPASEVAHRAWMRLADLHRDADRSGGYQPAGSAFDVRSLDNPAGALVGHASGLVELDRALLGFEPGSVYVIGGRPGHGKTSLALSALLTLARSGVTCGLVSLEMTAEQIDVRLLSAMTGIPARSIRTAQLTDDQRRRILAAKAELIDLPLWIDATPTQTPEVIAGRARRLSMEHGVQVLAVDYLGLVSGTERGESEALRLSRISRRIKLLAKEAEAAILLLHQLNREVDKRSDHRPLLSDLRDSGGIEENADVVIFVVRHSLYSSTAPAAEAELVIRKNRQGSPCTVNVAFDGPSMRFSNLDLQHNAQGGWS